MKTFYKLATSALTLALMMGVVAACASAQTAETAALANLAEGQGVIASNGNPQWDGLSEIVLIPGSALMGASSTTTALYLGIYTPLKQRTSLATAIGAIPGAIPPLIGWAAVTGDVAKRITNQRSCAGTTCTCPGGAIATVTTSKIS